MGTFEENLDRVAFAGYHHIQMVGEFKQWSEADWTRILGRLETLKISVDATSGVGAGFAVPGGGDAFLASLKEILPAAKRLGCKQIILLSGRLWTAPRPGASMRHRSRP